LIKITKKNGKEKERLMCWNVYTTFSNELLLPRDAHIFVGQLKKKKSDLHPQLQISLGERRPITRIQTSDTTKQIKAFTLIKIHDTLKIKAISPLILLGYTSATVV
jgi:hypothetical protein